MSNQILFETQPLNTARAVILLSLLILVLAILLVAFALLNRKRKIALSTRICCLSAPIICMSIGIYYLVQVPLQKDKIYDEYKNGNFYTEEGYVSIVEYEENTEQYYLVVNETVFSLDDRQAYSYNYVDHKLCVSDGQYVKISYVKYRNKNLIMCIEAPIY